MEGNVLTDHPDVLKQSRSYPFIDNNFVKIRELPETFDGRDEWGTYILTPDNNKNPSWALVAKDVLNDRFCLQSGGQMLVNFDEFEIVSCIDIPPNKKVDNVISYQNEYKNIYEGYSIFDAWEYIYKFGVCQQRCFSESRLADKKIDPPSKIADYSDKIKLYGTDCSNLEDIGKTSCLATIDGKPIARRAFFCDSIYNVGDKDGNMEKTINQIKGEIVRWGPVAAGFILYENFVDEKKWNGRTVYDKVEGKPIGGHYVSIVGYGKDYWICRNNWGTDWGLLGYFKIKMGLAECQLEKNVSACTPYLYKRRASEKNIEGTLDGKVVNLFDMSIINPKLFKYRKYLRINFLLYYTYETIDLIKQKKLVGSLTPIIEYPKLLPNMNEFWVMDILDFNYKVISEEEKKDKSTDYTTITAIVLGCIFLGYIGYNGYNGYNSYKK